MRPRSSDIVDPAHARTGVIDFSLEAQFGVTDFPDIWRAFFIGAAKGAVLDCHRSNRPASNPDSVRSARNGRPSHRKMLYVDAPARGIPDTALN
jgi:hypothetical protein